MLLPLLGLLLGLIVGLAFPINIPAAWSSYVSIGLLAAMDSLIGGFRAELENRFDSAMFVTGFLGNVVLAAGLAYLGDRLDVPLYMAAIFAFGVRLFANFAVLRRLAVERVRLKRRNRETQMKETKKD